MQAAVYAGRLYRQTRLIVDKARKEKTYKHSHHGREWFDKAIKMLKMFPKYQCTEISFAVKAERVLPLEASRRHTVLGHGGRFRLLAYFLVSGNTCQEPSQSIIVR